MLIWLFQTGEPLQIDQGNNRPMRAMNLANTLLARGHKVVLWSADFDHINKRFRNQHDGSIEVEPDLEIRLLPSTGYQRNVGFARLFDHVMLSINLKKRLRHESHLPDVAFVGYPPIETAYVLTRWCRARGVPTLLDIKDQWPLIFSNALPKTLRPLGSFLLYPYTCLARRAMRSASALSAMAEGFLNWALTFCGKTRSDNDKVFPLTTPTGQIGEAEILTARKWWDELGVTDAGICRLSFIGSFSPAFDFLPIKLAAEAALKQSKDIQFVLCGEGGNADQVKAMMHGLPNVMFPGWIDRPKIEVLAERCIASIAPYRNTPDFMLSIPNKVVDSLSLGLPVLSPLQGEVASLIDNHTVGLRYDDAAGTADESLYHSIMALSEDKKLQNTLSSNARDLYNARFSFEQVYGSLVAHLEHLAASSSKAALNMRSDKKLELERYENRAREALAGNLEKSVKDALLELPPALQAPYICYQSQISSHIAEARMRILEIGAGTGLFSEMILKSGAQLVATDISQSALEVLAKRLAGYNNLETRVADMESLPFEDACFDAVLSAGSLSYGDNRVVMNEIKRVLKPGGRFICVDSLNHNPVYRFNRWLQYLRSGRTRSTIERMPTQQLIRSYGDEFGQVNEWYFGSVTWIVPVLNIFFNAEKVGRISDKIDRLVNVTKSAFKFVMVVHKSAT